MTQVATRNDVERSTRAFSDITGQIPTGVWFAPGRVNLIGEHTDYNDGFVLPFALQKRAVVAASKRSDRRWRVTSLELGESIEIGPAELVPGSHGWAGYLFGVIWALQGARHEVGGAEIVLTSDVPLGAGLSSSAALECATMAALADLYGLQLPAAERVRLSRLAENSFVGAPTGPLDQAASTLCLEDSLLFLDCRTLESRQVPFNLRGENLEILVCDTRTPHAHVTGEYAERRASCEAAARELGVRALRDVTDPDAVRRLSSDVLRRRARHVVTENARVLQTVRLAEEGRLRDIGQLLNASHDSMRDDFEITCPQVDLAVETARSVGAYGARMTGGGFGGCTLSLIEAGTAGPVAKAIGAAFAAEGYAPPAFFTAAPAPGAGRLV